MSIAERIECFRFIQNIPYKIGLYRGSPDYCCSSKSVMLRNLLHNIGLESRYIICTFDWTQTPAPSDVLKLPREPGETHQYLQVFIPETQRWIDCDPTWDETLRYARFPIASWDGLTSTTLAVKPLKIYTPQETLLLIEGYNDQKLIDKHLDFCRDFYQAFNQWLEKIRKENGE